MFENEVIKEIIEKYRVLWAIEHALSLMSWDTETYMPKAAASDRGIAAAELNLLSRKIMLSDEFTSLVDKAEKQEGLNDYEKGVVRVLKRAIRIYKAIPPKLLEELVKTTTKARIVWREAKEKDDYAMFKDYLDKIVKLCREIAEHLGYDEHPYDALLDLHEEGLRTRDVDNIFNAITSDIKSILDKVLSEGYYPREHPLERVKYDIKAMESVNREILDILGYPKDRARLDVSAHPFTIGMSIYDVRITTRYEGYDFKRSLFSVIHEFGHALYDLQIDPAISKTPIGSGVSLGVHESQSRFWENIIGRSREFTNAIYDILRKHLEFLKDYDVEEVYRYFNCVKPSFIRTEADEVTYNLHILLRFKLEKLMIAGEVKVEELPELWNNTMDELLGIKPSTYREGILQDIHWSMGNIGYFPTYTIGNILSAQIAYHADRDLGGLKNLVSVLKLEPIREYLKEKIHRWGSTYEPKELIRRSFGEDINPRYFIEYLKSKFLSR